ncbi:MAG: SusC/RagA family TonB-linked outer membrane protein [Bacteroidales bacterium]|nr:SusC/RagA family TonB-linked outer membrane protein [Candidatus Liminaster caballi]
MKKLLSVIVVLVMSVTMMMAQKTITGHVVAAEDGEPIIGAAVMVKGTTQGVATDIDGNFTIKVPASAKTLVVSYLGMTSQEVPVKDKITVKLESDSQVLDDIEIVSTGMGNMDKRLFTGSSQKIDAGKVQLAGATDVSRSLEGRVSGVQVTNVSGAFGASPKIRVRGATSIYGNSKPLWVIDGVIYEDNVDVSADELSSGDAKTLISSAVAGLNSDDIESFTILKDGSATSIYGARAMAGVIVITTKKGSKGRASVNYTGEFSTRLKPSYKNYNIMNSQEMMGIYKEMEDKGWLQIESLSNASNSGVYGYMFQQLRKFDETSGKYGLENTIAARNAYLQEAEFRNTDWFDMLFSTAVSQNHSVSIAGGTEKSQTYFSMSLMNDPGYFVNRNSVKRYTFNGNTSYDILKNVTVKLAAQGSHRDQEAPGSLNQTTDVVTGEVKRDFDINPFSFAMNTSRCLDPNINYTRFYNPFNIFNELENNYNDIAVDEIMMRGEIEYKPIKSVTLSGLISARMSHTKRQHNVMDDSNQANAYRAGADQSDDNSTIRDSNPLLYTDPDNDLALPESVLPQGGIKYQYDDKMRSNNLRFIAEYRDVYNEKHTVNAMAGTELSTVRRTATNWTGWGYQYNNGGITYTPYLWLKMCNEENTEYFGESFTQTNTLAFYGQAVYSFDQRYTINGTFRYEGTNRLGKATSSRWLPTWNISGSYDMGSEPFMESIRHWLSQLKFRGSYSLTADTGPSFVTNATAIYKTVNIWRPTTSAAESGIEIESIANTELTYEKKHELNVGADFGFIDDRLALTADVYWRNNFDLIGRTYTQGAGGQIAKWANVADMESSGVELGLSTVNIQQRGFRWTSDLIWTKTKNKITNLKTSSRAIDLVSASGYALQGFPVRAIFSYQFSGLNEEGLPVIVNEYNEETVGDINFQETEGLENFLKYEGPSDPTWYGSFNNSFSYNHDKLGKFGLDVFITYSGGNVVRLEPVFSSAYSDLSALPREFKNRWMMPGDEQKTDIPTIATRNQLDRYGSSALSMAYNAYNYSTARIASGDFVRLKEVAFTYTMPQKLVAKSGFISNASLKVSGTNLCLLYADKKLNGQDPEFINAGGVSSPISKQWTLTVRLGF